MKPWMLFLAAIVQPLWELFEYLTSGRGPDPELEKQLAMNIIRAAKDAQARAEIEGS